MISKIYNTKLTRDDEKILGIDILVIQYSVHELRLILVF